MKKDRSGNYFEDFRIGMKISHATPRTLTEGDRSLYIGLTGSRTALCTAETNARQLGFEHRPLEDLLVFNTAFGKTVPDISLNAVANLGYAEVRFVSHVYPGDTLAVETEVIGLKENSNRKSGVVYVRSTARNQHGREVLSWVRWVMVHKRDHGAACGEAVVPSTQAVVPAERLRRSDYTARVREITGMTGYSDLWEDYGVGERIDHPGAMTINDSDHSLATRLYQNTARAHFDGHAMTANGGQRLVYGGHIISVCRALAYDGLENGLSILAINGGSHVNPTYAGDTIACATQVLEKVDLGREHVGALHLRMIGVKNASGASIAFPEPGEDRPVHPSNVVLAEVIAGDARRARNEFGFLRMWSIYPAQIQPIVNAMRPDFTEVEDAAGILVAAQDADWGPIQYKGELHDRATYRYFWEVLQKAKVTGMTVPDEADRRFLAN